MATRKAARAARTRTTKARTPVSASSRRRTTAAKGAGRVRERRRQAPETLRLREFQLGFTVNDIERSVRFYSDVLGFFVSERWTDGGSLRGVMLKAGLCQLGLSQDDWAKGRDRQKGQGVRVWCQTVQDIDALAARIRKAGWTLTEEPTDQPWGARSLSLDDPDGFHLTIYEKR
jgi:catechol 2,3-dioxygenase-like lactoylglutathione lyase family enzyme